MGANTDVYVKVAKVEWIKVSAVTLEEAAKTAKELPDVAFVMVAQYDQPQ